MRKYVYWLKRKQTWNPETSFKWDTRALYGKMCQWVSGKSEGRCISFHFIWSLKIFFYDCLCPGVQHLPGGGHRERRLLQAGQNKGGRHISGYTYSQTSSEKKYFFGDFIHENNIYRQANIFFGWRLGEMMGGGVEAKP